MTCLSASAVSECCCACAGKPGSPGRLSAPQRGLLESALRLSRQFLMAELNGAAHTSDGVITRSAATDRLTVIAKILLPVCSQASCEHMQWHLLQCVTADNKNCCNCG